MTEPAVDGKRIPLVAGKKVYVYKKDWSTGRTLIKWPATVRSASPTQAVVQAVFRNGPAQVDGVSIDPGDVFTEHYYSDRYYNIFHIAAPDGRLKGWYCNVALPAVFERNSVSFVDLKLDVFVHPDGQASVLDEDEFEAACAECWSSDLTPVIAHARSSVDDLLELARRGELPRAPSPQPSPRGRGGSPSRMVFLWETPGGQGPLPGRER